MAEQMEGQRREDKKLDSVSPNPPTGLPWPKWFRKTETSILPKQDADLETPLDSRRSRKAIPELPRSGTFKRQESEKRENLEPSDSRVTSSRTRSVDQRRSSIDGDPPNVTSLAGPRVSAPGLLSSTCTEEDPPAHSSQHRAIEGAAQYNKDTENTNLHKSVQHGFLNTLQNSLDDGEEDLDDELDKRWILNLSMHFRDRSNREKFFVTYAETPTLWRRVTLSLDYRGATPGSLEAELQDIQLQREKSARIYESIRESLADIQFYDTVTNLKLQTEDDRLHVHVTEDVYEIISYPPVSSIAHLNCPHYKEDQIIFDSHLSGFVYKVRVGAQVLIKKEIPSPDTINEFLYEINALHRLSGAESVIDFQGVVVDKDEQHVKGLLISYAEYGALIDVMYDSKVDVPISWVRRERWARQIVQGLSEIHEAGFVQGDFTLSNIVIDSGDNAKIIDINRRGCPMGWEPPEVADLLSNKQKISMFIGVKSDIFQLGMVLWAIAMNDDEPETHRRPLTLDETRSDIPDYLKILINTSLHNDPRRRSQATDLLALMPPLQEISEARHNLVRAYPQTRDSISDHSLSDIRGSRFSNQVPVRSHNFLAAPTDDFEQPRGRTYKPGGRSRKSSEDGAEETAEADHFRYRVSPEAVLEQSQMAVGMDAGIELPDFPLVLVEDDLISETNP